MGAQLAKLAVNQSAGNNMTYKLEIKQKTIKRIIELRSMRDNRLSVKSIEYKVGKVPAIAADVLNKDIIIPYDFVF